MSNTAVILGTLFGDEGKGKVVDYLSKGYDYVVRYQGGDNAGHTIRCEGIKHVLKLIPAGVFQSKAIIAQGVVLNPVTLLQEIDYLKEFMNPEDRIFISDHVHIIFPFHIEMDKLMEEIRDEDKIDSTHRGIGPCYGDKSNRLGIRLCDLFDKDVLFSKLSINLQTKNPLFSARNYAEFCPKALAEEYYLLGKKIERYSIDAFSFFRKELDAGKTMLFEGSQGILLDLDHGTYPFVTSSNIISSLSSGTSLPPSFFKKIYGIVKAYSTRVGNGILPSKIANHEISEHIRKVGKEYGSVTGRPRKIGWLDLHSIQYSVSLAGITDLVLTLVDVLSGMEEVLICIGYEDENGKKLPINLVHQEGFKPIYKKFKGWNDDLSKTTTFSALSLELRNYICFIENFLSLRISFISTGQGRDDVLIKGII